MYKNFCFHLNRVKEFIKWMYIPFDLYDFDTCERTLLISYLILFIKIQYNDLTFKF